MKRYISLFEKKELEEVYHRNIRVGTQDAIIFINPKYKEVKELLDMYHACRGFVNEDGSMFLWQGYIIHSDMMDALNRDGDSYWKRLFKGNHKAYEDRNYITVILENDGLLYFGDSEEIEEIKENDDLELSVLVHNTLRKNKWVKFSKDFKGIV